MFAVFGQLGEAGGKWPRLGFDLIDDARKRQQPPSKNRPARVPSASRRLPSQNDTTTKTVTNTTPTSRQNKATSPATTTENSRSRSSSRSVDNSCRRVCAMASRVAEKFFSDSNKPLLSGAASAMARD